MMDNKIFQTDEIKINYDNRGYFFESFRSNSFKEIDFVQDNISFSIKGALRGLHYQYEYAQSKLITVIKGEIFDVIVDLRRDSETFLKKNVFNLSDSKINQIFIPRGYAHGFQCISDQAIIYYKTDNYYKQNDQYGVNPFDHELNIEWPLSENIINQKDISLPNLSEVSKLF